MSVEQQAADFVSQVVKQMGLGVQARVETNAEGTRINLEGDGAEVLLAKRGEGLQALQHIVDSAFRRQLGEGKRLFIDCMDFRKGKDNELKAMARFLAEKAKTSGTDQQLGPLNPYERRIVHMAVSEIPGVTTESVGDAFSKTVLISLRK